MVVPGLSLPSDEPLTVPATSMGAFVQKALLSQESPLWNVDHDHLGGAEIGYLFTNAVSMRRGQQILGQAELIGSPGGNWSKARSRQQLREWFPGQDLDFIITLYAPYVVGASPADQMALLEHEHYHCGQKHDDYGVPMFSKIDGRPIYTMRGHDVEEFVAVSRRYGAGAGKTLELAEAIRLGPEFDEATIGRVCGSCLR